MNPETILILDCHLDTPVKKNFRENLFLPDSLPQQ